MDPFTERILQKAEQRSKTLGISKTAKYPLSQVDGGVNADLSASASSTTTINNLQVVQKKIEVENLSDYASPTKVKRQFSVDKENRDLGIEINITTGPNVEVEVAVEEHDIELSDNSNDKPAVKVREAFRNRLQKLGALYSNSDDLSSPIHRTEGKFHENVGPIETKLKRPIQKFGKLVALAESIKNWEDDTSHPDYKHFKAIADIHSPTKKIAKIDDNIQKKSDQNENKNATNVPSQTRKLTWDQNVFDSLEAQGFQKRESTTTKFSYEYKDNTSSSDDTTNRNNKLEQTIICGGGNNEPKNLTVSSTYKTGIVSGRAAAYENKVTYDSPKKNSQQKDPAEMTLKERMQLFEKNKGVALMPKAAFGMAAPIKKNIHENKFKKQENSPKTSYQSKGCGNKETESNIKGKVAALIASSKSTISENQIKAELMKQKEHDMNILAKRYQRVEQFEKQSTPPPPPPPPPMSAATNNNSIGTNKRRSPSVGNTRQYESEIVAEADEKRPKTSIGNRLYPILSDIESTESDIGNNYTTATVSGTSDDEKHRYSDELTDSFIESENNDSAEICNVSLGREIMQAVHTNESRDLKKRKEVTYADKETYYGDSSVNSYASDGLDDYLNEALEDDCDSDETNSENDLNVKNKGKGTKSSNSFCYQKQPKKFVQTQMVQENDNEFTVQTSNGRQYEPVKSALSVNRSDENDMVTLVHTVSFYRKQQTSNSNNSTPIRKVSREQLARIDSNCEETTEHEASDESSSDRDDSNMVQEKIKKLLDEVCKQQQVIGQTSQALNLCAATIEFSGSTESVEGERHLLVATHRRQAALDEVQRLRVERCIRPRGAPKEKGRLTVKEITIPLRQDYIRKLSADTISGHHLVCLLKYNENVLATKTVPTLPGLLAVKFPDVLQLNNVYADFKITVEVYGMTAQREVLPHEVKYHINLNKKHGGIKTPKKKTNDSRLIMPMMQSPAGPNVVRTPALVQYGFTIFSLREIQRNTWTLNQVTGVSPLDGIIHMKVNCELSVSVEYKGFLTMFEDISGFGAWHRRWCYLNGHVLSYWKYPDDERKKTPMGSIDLYTCCSSKIKTAPRDICARLNTMLLECQRLARDDDIESLLIVPKGKTTIIRNLLSADTKEERDEWCAYFNKALTLIRAWGPQ